MSPRLFMASVYPLLVFSGVSLVTLILGIAGGFRFFCNKYVKQILCPPNCCRFSRNTCRFNQVNAGPVHLQLVLQMADREQLQSNLNTHKTVSRWPTTATSELMRMNTGRRSTIKSRSRYRSRR